jgi:hypothetical protein
MLWGFQKKSSDEKRGTPNMLSAINMLGARETIVAARRRWPQIKLHEGCIHQQLHEGNGRK